MSPSSRPWGFDLTAVTAAVLLVQGEQDRVIPQSHADRLHRRLPCAHLWSRRVHGHVSVLHACAAAMDWLHEVSAP
jgi:pimeloyl-ACP methyl ester carboxylesterase